MLSLFRRQNLPRPAAAVRPAQPRAAPLAAAAAEAGAAHLEPPPGCGWFDSSHELRRGLRVEELGSVEGLAPLLPPDDWLALRLQGGPLAGAPGRH
jgi:hypothetical protein